MLEVIELSQGSGQWSVGFGNNLISMIELSHEFGVSKSEINRIKKICRGYGNQWIIFDSKPYAQKFAECMNEKNRRKKSKK